MRRPKSRQRRVFVTDELVDLFRKAMPAHQALFQQIITGKQMSDEKDKAARAACAAFNAAAGVMPWEHSPLSPRANGPGPLQSALVAKLNGVELKAWRKFASKWQKNHDDEMAAFEAARRRQNSSPSL
jgi:hypothetical protein